MIGLIQRVTRATVSIDQVSVGAISEGILALIGIEKEDTLKTADRLLEKIVNYRIFDDADGKMNLSVKDVTGGLLLVSQFTLVADTKSGTRPGFSVSMAPAEAEEMFSYLVKRASEIHPKVASGKFGANMQIDLCNNGPVTFILKA